MVVAVSLIYRIIPWPLPGLEWGAVRRLVLCCAVLWCRAARKIRSWLGLLGFALIFNSGRHRRLRRSSHTCPAAPSHPSPHLHAFKHPCREHSLEFSPFLGRRGHSLFQPESAGISRFAAPSLSAHPSAWPRFRAAAPLNQDPKRSGRERCLAVVSHLFSVLTPAAWGEGHAHAHTVPTPDSTNPAPVQI